MVRREGRERCPCPPEGRGWFWLPGMQDGVPGLPGKLCLRGFGQHKDVREVLGSSEVGSLSLPPSSIQGPPAHNSSD